MSEREYEPIWCQIKLAEVAYVVENYSSWKDDPWCHHVDWVTVSCELTELLEAHAVDGGVPNLSTLVKTVLRRMERVDAEGLRTLVHEPITITPVQLTSGGHRLKAMMEQEVEAVPGLFQRGAVGESVRASQVFPLKRQ